MPSSQQVDCVLPAQGKWGVAVSGGADSVALLRLAAQALPSSALHVIHLDHETRGDASRGDASFVEALANTLELPKTIRRLSDLPPSANRATLTNLSARYRMARLELYRDVGSEFNLSGVLLAHHADDQAETVLLRLLRGSGYPALAGMSEESVVRGIRLVRPLLRVSSADLRRYLTQLNQPWREDASNATGTYARNRVRQVLAERPALIPALLQLGQACRALRTWVERSAPVLPDRFAVSELAGLPDVLAEAAAGDWLNRAGVPADQLSPAHVQGLIEMCQDAASPARQMVPGRRRLCRQKGFVVLESPA